LGPSINDVTALGGRGIKDFVTTVLKPYYLKRDDGGRGVKNYQNCVMSFMDDPIVKKSIFGRI
jgi:hypothetical protein